MAKISIDFELKGAEQASKTYKQVLNDFRANEKELKALAIAGDTTSKRYQELARSVGAAKASLDNANRSITAQKGSFDTVIGSIGGAAAGFAALRGAAGLFGAESENLQKSLLKVQSALALAQGLKQFQEAIPTFKVLTTIVGKGLVGAFGSLRSAIISTGIGALVVAIGFAISKIVEWKNSTDELSAAQEKLNDVIGNTNSLISSTIQLIDEKVRKSDEEIAKLQLQGATEKQIFDARQKGLQSAIRDGQRNINLIEQQIEIARRQGKSQDDINKLIEEKEKIVLKVSGIEKKVTNDQIVENNRLAEVERTNLKRRTQLISNELSRRLAELRNNYNEERKLAIKNGEDLSSVDILYFNKRKELLEKTNTDYLNITNNFYLDLAKLTDGGLELQLAQIKKSNAEEIGAFTTAAQNRLAAIKAASGDINKFNQEFDRDFNALIVKQQIEYFEFLEKNLSDGYKVLVDLEKQLGSERIKTIKQANNISEDLTKLSLASFEKEYRLKDRIQRQALRNATIADAEYFFTKVKLAESDEGLTEKQIQLYNLIEKARKENTNDEVAEAQAIADIRQNFFDTEFKRVNDYYTDLSNLQKERLIDEIKINIENVKLEKRNNKEKLDLETKYFEDLNKLQEKDGRNVEKFNDGKLILDRKLKIDQLNLELNLLESKLKLYGEDTDEYKKFQLEKLKLLNQLSDIENNVIIDGVKKDTDTNDAKRRNIERYVQESINLLNELQFTIGTFYDLDVARFNAAQDKKLKKLKDTQNAEINNYALTSEQVENINRRYALEEAKIEEERAKKNKEIEKKRANTNFQITIAQILANTGLAILRAFADLGPVAAIPAAAFIGTTAALQVTAAENQRRLVTKLEDGGLLRGPSHSQGGIPVGNSGIEVEGNEYVVNKRSTAAFLPLLEMINSVGRNTPRMPQRLENGGMLSNDLIDAISTNNSSIIKTYVTTTEVKNKVALENRIIRKSKF